MGERPSIDHSPTPPIGEAQKFGERKQDRFNEVVANELDREFAENHDVGGLYFTHAFPSKNLESIIDEGGLRTPAQLEKRGVGFATGSYATVRGEIFFSRDDFHTGYSTNKEKRNAQGGCGILVPQAEFHRLRRFWKNTEGSRSGRVSDEGEYLDTKNRRGEHAIVSESDRYGDPSTDSARKLAEQFKEKRLREIEEAYQKTVEGIKLEFNRTMAELPPVEGFATEAESVLSYTEYSKRGSVIPERMRELQRTIESTQKKIRDLEPRISEEQDYVRTREAQAVQRRAQLEPKGFSKLLEKFGIGTAEREQKIKKIEDILARNKEDLNALLAEKLGEQTASETSTARINALELYKKMCDEFINLIGRTKRDREDQKKDIEERYAAREKMGPDTQKIRERLRKRDETEDTEDKFRVGLARSIILVDSEQIENALKATEGKPDLRARILVYDVSEVREEFSDRHTEMFPESGNAYIVPDALNAAQKLLSRTEDGLAILKTAQRGLPIKEPFRIAGIKRLDEYLEEQKEAEAA